MAIGKKKLVLCFIAIGCVLLLGLTAVWYAFGLKHIHLPDTLEIPDEVWDDDTLIYENSAKAFAPAVGKTMIMDLKVRPNKKNPQYPYRNYDFDEAEQPETLEVTDDEMPF